MFDTIGDAIVPSSRRLIRQFVVTLCLALAVSACGSDEMSLTEYVDQVNAAAAKAGDKAEQLTEQGVLTEALTPQELEAGIERSTEEIRIPLQASVDALDPPEQVAELHALLWSWHADLIRVETTLAQRVGATPHTETGWTELSDSPEMAAYRASIAEGKQVCIDFQAKLDATEARGVFEDVAWLPSKLSEVVEAALGCEWFPENPQDIYRYPPQ